MLAKRVVLKEYDIDITSLKKIKEGVINLNYRVLTGSGECLLKIYNWRKPEEVEFELGVLDYLASKNFPCPRIIKNRQGDFYSFIQDKPVVLLDYISGETLREISSETLYKTGVLTGRLHRVLRGYKQSVKKDWRLSPPPEDFKKYLKIEVGQFPKARNFIDFIVAEFEKIDLPTDLPQGITHQDIKPDNILVDKGGGLSFIDFDNIYRGALLYDIMTVVVWTCFKENVLCDDSLDSFLQGYELERGLTNLERKYFNNALRFRLLREAFAWGPTRFNTRLAKKNCRSFLTSYKNLCQN
ncbi:MAG: homoserine kinase [Patescibacteria group bacterium]